MYREPRVSWRLVVMCAAFSGFVAGRIVGLQEFGLGLAVAIFVDATVVRSLLVPSLMALFGRFNWWLPPPLARIVRVPPSPLSPPEMPLSLRSSYFRRARLHASSWSMPE